MSALFVALGIMVLALLALLLWFVPHLLQQQATRVAGETAQLREMLLDLLNEQEAVTIRQTQLGTSLSNMQTQLIDFANNGNRSSSADAHAAMTEYSLHQLETRLSEIQGQIQVWSESRQHGTRLRTSQENESWANLMSLLGSIQERIGALSQDRTNIAAGLRAGALLEELEHEMQNLHGISEEIAKLQWRLHRSLHDRESNLSVLRTRTSSGNYLLPTHIRVL